MWEQAGHPTAALQLPRNCVLWGICISHIIFERALNRDGLFVLVFVSNGMCIFRSCKCCSCSDNDRELLCGHCWPAVNHSNDGKPPTGLKLQRIVRGVCFESLMGYLFCLSLALFPWRAEGTRFLLTASLCSLVPQGLQRWKDSSVQLWDKKYLADVVGYYLSP